jgi:hypothetical protein
MRGVEKAAWLCRTESIERAQTHQVLNYKKHRTKMGTSSVKVLDPDGGIR